MGDAKPTATTIIWQTATKRRLHVKLVLRQSCSSHPASQTTTTKTKGQRMRHESADHETRMEEKDGMSGRREFFAWPLDREWEAEVVSPASRGPDVLRTRDSCTRDDAGGEKRWTIHGQVNSRCKSGVSLKTAYEMPDRVVRDIDEKNIRIFSLFSPKSVTKSSGHPFA